jgi:hypothetical protein
MMNKKKEQIIMLYNTITFHLYSRKRFGTIVLILIVSFLLQSFFLLNKKGQILSRNTVVLHMIYLLDKQLFVQDDLNGYSKHSGVEKNKVTC